MQQPEAFHDDLAGPIYYESGDAQPPPDLVNEPLVQVIAEPTKPFVDDINGPLYYESTDQNDTNFIYSYPPPDP